MQPRFLQPAVIGAGQEKMPLHSTARALALFFGGFSLLNLLGDFRLPGFDANLWWIDLRVNARNNAGSPGGMKSFCRITALCLVCLAAFPVAQMICFGKTDYRRAGDVAVVFGARAYKDGRPSDALADRVKTACQLYRDGLVKKLIFSGGPGDGAVTESEAMRRMALGLGVQANDILTDDAGLNTQATVKNTEAMFARLGARKILVVSHFYHLPRVKMAYHRAGWEVYTVPAKETYFLRQTPFFVAREVAALWVYYLRPLA